jgi:hypothetical protein
MPAKPERAVDAVQIDRFLAPGNRHILQLGDKRLLVTGVVAVWQVGSDELLRSTPEAALQTLKHGADP